MSDKKKTVNEKIADELNLDYEEPTKEITKKPETPLAKQKEDADKDYRSVRGNLYSIISKGNEAIDGILEVAQEGDSPRAYEVAAQMIKTVAEANKDLMDLHKKMKDINKEETNINNTTNNALYIGSTSELQDLINQSRSAKKALSNDVIDAEVVDDDG